MIDLNDFYKLSCLQYMLIYQMISIYKSHLTTKLFMNPN